MFLASYLSVLIFGFDNKFSPTSHLMFSLVMFPGKYILECLSQPWQGSAGISWHLAFMATSRDIW